MTITSSVSRVDCPGNSSATTFSFSPVVITEASDLVVYLLDNLGNYTLLTQGLAPTQYAVTVASYPGTGSISYPGSGGVTLPTGWKLIIKQQAPLLQEFQPQNQGPFLAQTYGDAFDYAMLCIQDLQEQINRAVLVAPTDPASGYVLPVASARANQISAFDSVGNPTTASVVTGTLVSSAMTPVVTASTLVAALTLLGGMPTLASVAALRANALATPPPVILLPGYYTPADKGGGMFLYVASDVTTADNGGTVLVDSLSRRWYRIGDSSKIDVRWFGAKGDASTDDSVAINAAFTFAANVAGNVFFSPGTYMVADHGLGWGIQTKGISFSGVGRDQAIIAPVAGFSASADIMTVTPATGAISFMDMSGVLIYPGLSGTVRGKCGIYLDFSGACQISELHIHDLYIQASNNYGIEINNNPVTNAQGNPSNSVIERCGIWDGLKFDSVGDSVTVRNCFFRGTPGSAHSGILALVQNGAGGISSHLIIEQCNLDCPAAAIWILDGRNVKIRDCNIESSYGTGSSSAAVIDIDGTSGTVVMPEITGCHIGIFGTSVAATAIRINASLEAIIEGNTLLAGFAVTQAIALTANATNTFIGINEFQSNFATNVNNLGTGTRGILIPLSPGNSYANVGSGSQTLGYWQTKDGSVFMTGLLSTPANPSGVACVTLPAAAWPIADLNFPAYALVSGAIAPQSIRISAAGVVSYAGTNTGISQVGLDGITFPTKTGIVGSS